MKHSVGTPVNDPSSVLEKSEPVELWIPEQLVQNAEQLVQNAEQLVQNDNRLGPDSC